MKYRVLLIESEEWLRLPATWDCPPRISGPTWAHRRQAPQTPPVTWAKVCKWLQGNCVLPFLRCKLSLFQISFQRESLGRYCAKWGLR